MSRVGIITFHCADNFGAFLQVYALQEFVRKFESDVEIIDYRPNELVLPYKEKIDFGKQMRRRGTLWATLSLAKSILRQTKNYSGIKRRSDKFSEMRQKYLCLSEKTYLNKVELARAEVSYDYYITGSDQVWNPSFIKDLGTTYFLDFVQSGAVKISYAASIAERVPQDKVWIFRDLVSKLDHISVREQTAKDFLDDIVKRDVSVHLDPTLLLNAGEWRAIASQIDLTDKYLLVYDLQPNDELVALANRIAIESGYKVVSYSGRKDYCSPGGSFKYSGPTEFLGLVDGAEMILSTSFHGIAFAVIFEKPFYAFPNSTRGSRIVDLLTLLNLDDRVVHKSEDVRAINVEIDYFSVRQLLHTERNKSLKYLTESLDVNKSKTN